MRAVACQGFAGAFALGVTQAGFDLRAVCERQGMFGTPMVQANRHLLGDDWEAHEGFDAWPDERDVDLLFGNPPCSNFSSLSVSIQHKDWRGDWRSADNPVNECMWEFVRYGARLRAPIMIFESVQQAFTSKHGRPLMTSLWQELEARTGDKYTLTHVKQNDLSLGGFGMRKRYFWVASRVPFGVRYPKPLDRVPTLRDCIGDLVEIELGWGGEEFGHHVLETLNNRRMWWLAQQVEWNQGEMVGEASARYKDRFPDDWYKKDGSPIRHPLGTNLYSPRRLRYDHVTPVLRGKSMIEFMHPTLPRTITYREAARFMSYPDTWNVAPAVRSKMNGALWFGKQIPVTAGRWIAEAARDSLEGKAQHFGELIADRERLIDVTHAWKAKS